MDALILHQVELPAFSTLDTIAEQVHTRTQTALFRRVALRLSDEEHQRLGLGDFSGAIAGVPASKC